MLLIGRSKLGWFVRLKISRLYFSLKRSVSVVILTMDMSPRFCHDWRKMLRRLLLEKLVSKVSPGGIAEHGNVPSTCWAFATLHGSSNGTVKQAAFSAGWLMLFPMAPVTALFAVQPGAKGARGL